jgi:hypothetical protein
MGTFTALREAIIEYVDQKKASGAVIELNQATIRLAAKYPQTGLTIDEIAMEIARTAAYRGVVIFADRTIGGGASLGAELKSKPDG